MPLHEYDCGPCGKTFELLVREGTPIVCPFCGSAKVAKRLSAFSARVGGGPSLPPCRRDGPGCDPGKCGSGRCGLE